MGRAAAPGHPGRALPPPLPLYMPNPGPEWTRRFSDSQKR